MVLASVLVMAYLLAESRGNTEHHRMVRQETRMSMSVSGLCPVSYKATRIQSWGLYPTLSKPNHFPKVPHPLNTTEGNEKFSTLNTTINIKLLGLNSCMSGGWGPYSNHNRNTGS